MLGVINEVILSWMFIGYIWDGGYYEVLVFLIFGGFYIFYGIIESIGGKIVIGFIVMGLFGGINYFVVCIFILVYMADFLEVYQVYNDFFFCYFSYI